MRRGPKPAKSKEAKPPVARKSPKDDDARVRDLEKRLAEALQREAEALEKQTATSEILRVISRYPTNLQPVLDAIATNAAQLCGAYDAILVLREGNELRRVAHHGPIASAIREVRPITQADASGRAILDGGPVHVHDILATEGDDLADSRESAKRFGFRTMLAVPLLREGDALGALTIRRRVVQPFTEKQIALVQTFADQAVIAIENARLFNETKEALEQQTATSEILQVISSSPTDVQPVFETIVASCKQLLNARSASVVRVMGDQLHLAAFTPTTPDADDELRHFYPRPITSGTAVATVARERAPFIVPDTETDARLPESSRTVSRARGYRSMLMVPMLRKGEMIGIISVSRAAAGSFAAKDISLLQTFADQAVIAIENVRLFNETKEALERQTATANILRVISSSPTNVQPTFEAIAESATRLCGAVNGLVFRFDGELIHLAAHHNIGGAELDAILSVFPIQPGRGSVAGRAIESRRIVHVEDLAQDPEYEQARVVQAGFRTALSIPMLRDGVPIGTINVMRMAVAPFSPIQISLLQTFADQAVIAIENVRLFNETKAALDRQTATSEILGVISSSPTDTQPVFDAIARNAVALCGGIAALVLRYDGEMLHIAGHHEMSRDAVEQVERAFPRRPGRDYPSGRALLERHVVHVPDLQAATEFTTPTARQRGLGSMLVVPLLREGEAIGVISLGRDVVGPFSAQQIEILQTFGDQAVIAIENVRLFTELQEKNHALTEAHAHVIQTLEQQTATSEILQTIAQAQTDVQPVFDAIVRSAAQLCHAHTTAVFLTDGQVVYHPANYGDTPEALATSKARYPRPLDKETAAGTAILTRAAMHVPDIEEPSAAEFVRQTGRLLGFRSVLSVPMLRQGEAIGAINVTRRKPGPFSDTEVALLHTFADQAVIAIENVRLFKELEAANRGLAAASQHKSEFLANMSHELRTPLNAIIGFSEVLAEKMFGELNEKQEEYSKDIHASGQHLLSLINDILDLSKIEAGRMELELTDFHLPTALDSALTLVRERAGRRSIALHTNIDNRLGHIQADERKVRQVVLNLLSNAIKFTPEGGQIEVGAVPKDGLVEVSVIDTGVGIAPEDQEAVFEEFRQVGTADKKVEGTGLGLTLCRKFVELHGGRIGVKSELGVGSTFTFTIPVRHGE